MKTPPKRPRNAAATRDAILSSARAAFARAGYDGAGVREIASGAGVTAMLVNRYFGSKEKLFAEVVAASMATPTILSPAIHGASAAEHFASALVAVTTPGNAPLEGFSIMLRSASSEQAAEISRVQIEQHHHRTMTTVVRADQPEVRAAIALSLVAGLQVMRQTIGLSALVEVAPAMLERILLPVIEQLLGTTAKEGTARPATKKKRVRRRALEA